MCTLTWLYGPEGYRVLFNRDEKRSRLPADPPSIREIDGVKVLTPADGNAGGSWLAVNAHGITVAILNHYEADAALPASSGSHESRGRLVLDMAGSRSLADIGRRILTMDCSRYRPFILAAFDAAGRAQQIAWNGSSLEAGALHEDLRPVTTSSVQTASVLAARRATFESMREARGGVDPTLLREFHHSRDARGGAHSVTMTREDAQTVSFSEVEVMFGHVAYFYQPRVMALGDPPYEEGRRYEMERA